MSGLDNISVNLLGPPRWRRHQQGGPLAPRDAALFALLAVEGHVARDRVASWLWPEAGDNSRARLSLRQRLFRLRRECGHELLDASATLSLLPSVQVDLHRQPLADQGRLLAGLDFSAFEAFDEWLQAARAALDARQAEAMAEQSEALEASGAMAEAIVLVERIVATWPTTEHAWRRLMRLHWRRADRAAAIAVFERFERQVCREWGLRPSHETLVLLAEVERHDAEAGPATPLPPALLCPPVLIGRDAAVAAMTQAWEEHRASLLTATGGMGKTRMIDSFVAGRPGVQRVRARPGDAHQPYATLAQAMDQTLSRFAPPLTDEVRCELARVLPRLGPPPASPARGAALHSAVTAAWRAAMDRGLKAIAWDDLHWADAATLELLHSLLAEPTLRSLRHIFAARLGEGSSADELLPRWLGDSLRVHPISLRTWGMDDLCRLLGSLPLPPALAEDTSLPGRLLQQTGGQPFFVLETLKAQILAMRGGATVTTAPAVGAMIERRVSLLPEAPRRLLQLLAVAEAPIAMLGNVLHRGPLDLADDWAALAAAQLVRDDGVAHDLVRDAVMRTLPRQAVKALHQALAQALSRQPGVDPARLAQHWDAAGEPQEAATAWLQAGAAAVRTGRLNEALRLYQRARDSALQSADPSLQVAVLAAAQPTRLLVEGTAAVAADLQALQPAVFDLAARCRLLLLLGEVELSRMRSREADELARQAMALCDHHDDDTDPQLLADATLLHARTLAWTGHADAGVQLLQAACDRAEADGTRRRLLQAQATLADVLVAAGRRVEAARTQRTTLALARSLGDRFEAAVAGSNLAVHGMLIGDARTAFEAGGEALTAFADMGVEHVNRLMCAGVYALAAAHHGRFDLAQAAAEPLLRGPDDPVRRNLRNTLSTVALWCGQLQQARALLPPLDDDAPLSVRLTGLFTRLRWHAWCGADDSAERAALQRIGQAHPALRDDPHYYRAWAPFDPPLDAVQRLDALAMREDQAGAPANARTLALVAIQVLWPIDRQEAARRANALWPHFALGLHPAVLPSAAAWQLAQALHTGGHIDAADAAFAQARDWLQRVQLPAESRAMRQALVQGVPAHRALLSGWPPKDLPR